MYCSLSPGKKNYQTSSEGSTSQALHKWKRFSTQETVDTWKATPNSAARSMSIQTSTWNMNLLRSTKETQHRKFSKLPKKDKRSSLRKHQPCLSSCSASYDISLWSLLGKGHYNRRTLHLSPFGHSYSQHGEVFTSNLQHAHSNLLLAPFCPFFQRFAQCSLQSLQQTFQK